MFMWLLLSLYVVEAATIMDMESECGRQCPVDTARGMPFVSFQNKRLPAKGA